MKNGTEPEKASIQWCAELYRTHYDKEKRGQKPILDRPPKKTVVNNKVETETRSDKDHFMVTRSRSPLRKSAGCFDLVATAHLALTCSSPVAPPPSGVTTFRRLLRYRYAILQAKSRTAA